MFSILCLLFSVIPVFVQAYEPSCSQYSYVEAILERVVKVDHKMDLNHDKLTEWEKRIDQKLKNLKDAEENMVKSAKLQSDKIERELNVKKDGIDSEIGTFREHLDMMTKDITNKQASVSEVLTTMKDAPTTPTILFKARGLQTRTPAGGSTMIYTTVMTNIHTNMTGGYDVNTGIFTVPCTGTYLFTVQTCTIAGKYFHGKIMAAGKEIAAVLQYEDGTTLYTSATATALAVLSKGETVYVKCGGVGPSGNILHEDSAYWNVFSGVLLHTGTE